MRDYILLMHDDAPQAPTPEMWDTYLDYLRTCERFGGGSAIGTGESVRKDGTPAPLAAGLIGYVRIRAHDLADAKTLVAGNPVYESGGTVEVRELPRS